MLDGGLLFFQHEAVSHKSAKIAALLAELASPSSKGQPASHDPHYTGYFECFNRQMYYEAHDVLEDLWLVTKGDRYFFYKGLIQLAGAFVHLKKSHLYPAARLFHLALKNLLPSVPSRDGLDVRELVVRVQDWLAQLEDSHFTRSPYDPACPPRLELQKEGLLDNGRTGLIPTTP